ncbi:hypothetical protein QTJ16_004573 [Diplocarpon rosae]|uniref:Uncharacterized protein n=1 Tax=Diplocarpon rosae TaxID=946125 RepID=A0AAD9WEI7_9HELO|nr:hypothetical protein QTJ16_004573 [Diplocarpon rosae]
MALPPISPRLPSPPPPTEIQIGPKSPALGVSPVESTIEQSIIDANSKRRIHPGTKSADMAAGPPLVPLNELDSAFQLQEHLKALHYHYSKPPQSEDTLPISRETAILIATQPEGVDRALWLYELCRFLINKCNDLIVGFLFDDPPCSATTCPEMRASEWQFLCAVHESPKSCCAIDYCCHTLDWATNIVTSQKIFPSRLSLGAGDAVDERGASVKHLTNIFRRLHRIFAHAWFQHRGVFWQVEGQTGLYVLFKTVCDIYDLLPAENYKLPPEAEGLEPAEEIRAPAPIVIKSGSSLGTMFLAEDGSTRKNTRRHIRQSPSVGSAVTTVLEADEEDADVTQKVQELHIAEEGMTEIPVIVDSYEGDEAPGTSWEENEPASGEEEVIEQAAEASSEASAATTSSSNSSWDCGSSELQEIHDSESGRSESEKPEDASGSEPEEVPGEALLDTADGTEVEPALVKAGVEKEADEGDVELPGKAGTKADGEAVVEKSCCG